MHYALDTPNFGDYSEPRLLAELAREAINRYLADVPAATPATGKDKP